MENTKLYELKVLGSSLKREPHCNFYIQNYSELVIIGNLSKILFKHVAIFSMLVSGSFLSE